MVCFSRQNPGTCQIPADRCHHRQTPDASVRLSNLRALHPSGHVWLWSDSRRGIWKLLNLLTHLNQTALPNCTTECFPLARIRGALKCMR